MEQSYMEKIVENFLEYEEKNLAFERSVTKKCNLRFANTPDFQFPRPFS